MFKDFIQKMKSKVSPHLFSLIGWIIVLIIAFFTFDITYLENIDPNILGFGCAICIILLAYTYGIWLILFIIDLLIRYKIKNKFILENKIYNVFWIMGIIFSICIMLPVISIFCFF